MSARVLAFRARLVAVDAIRLGGVFHVGEADGPRVIASGTRSSRVARRPVLEARLNEVGLSSVGWPLTSAATMFVGYETWKAEYCGLPLTRATSIFWPPPSAKLVSGAPSMSKADR